MAAPPIIERHLPHFHRRAPNKELCRAATTANVTIATALNNGDTLDGITLATGDRVLVKDQTTASENGIYVVGTTPVRDYDESTDDPSYGYLVLVLQGTANAGTLWHNTNTSAPTIGSTSITFAAFTGGGLTDPMTTRGDIIVRNASNVTARLAIGAAGKILSSDGTDVSWGNGPMTTQDDIIIGGASGIPTRLAKGSDSMVLTVDPTTHHLVWATPSSGFSNPMTTKGDLIVGDTGGSAIRKGVGSDGQVLTADAASTGGLKWDTPSGGGGGGGIGQSFIGYDAIGASWQTITAFRVYWKQIVLSNSAQIVSIDVHLRPSTDNLSAINVMLAADNAGEPGVLLGLNASPSGVVYLSNSSSMPGAGRWLSVAMGNYLPAGTYWIGFTSDQARWDVAYDTGTDHYFTASGYYATGAYPSAWSITTSAQKWSIRASVLTVGGGGGSITYPALKPGTPTDDFTTFAGWSAHSNQGSFGTGDCIGGGEDWGGSSVELQFSQQMGTIYIAQGNTDFDFTFGGIRWQGMSPVNSMMFGIAALNSSGTGVGVIVYDDYNAYIASISSYSYGAQSDSWSNHGHNLNNGKWWIRLKRVSGTWTGYMSQSGRAWDKVFSTRSDSITVAEIHFGLLYNSGVAYSGRLTADYYQKDV